MREISLAVVELWGKEAQMLMVAEEATELVHAVLKWRRAWKKYNKKGVSLTRVQEPMEQLEEKAHQRYLEKCEKNLRTESMQLLFMLDQLQVMVPGDYDSALEKVLLDAVAKIEERGGQVLGT
jgi:flagellar motor component MotA